MADLASAFQLTRPTIRDYVVLLERIFLLEHLPSWHSNRLSRLIKPPRLHLADSGLAATLPGLDTGKLLKDRPMPGQLLETFVFQEIRRQASFGEKPMTFHHFLDKDGAEVDILLERGALEVAGVKIKAAATVTPAEFRGLKKLEDAAGDRFITAVALYDW